MGVNIRSLQHLLTARQKFVGSFLKIRDFNDNTSV